MNPEVKETKNEGGVFPGYFMHYAVLSISKSFPIIIDNKNNMCYFFKTILDI